jgi:AbrB family looped-hinge helix DNA binding protein
MPDDFVTRNMEATTMPATLSTIGDDGRITIPEEFRQALGIEPNDRVSLTLEDGTIRLQRVAPPPDGDWFWVPARNEWVQWQEIRRIAREEHAKQVADVTDRSDGE